MLSAAGLENLNSSQSLQDTETQRASIYMAVVLWSVAALSLFRFIGALWFLVARMVSSTPPRYCPGCLRFTSSAAFECWICLIMCYTFFYRYIFYFEMGRMEYNILEYIPVA